MKKMIKLSLAFLLAGILNYAPANSTDEPSKPGSIRTLIINADVNVVLINHENATLKVVGDKPLIKFVTFKLTGDTLLIHSSKTRNLKGAGTIYIPASRLENIRINSDAYVRSLSMLQVPKLDVVINGSCIVAISNAGEFNITGTSNYSFEQDRYIRRHPAMVFRQ
jgi:hypothetical protein